MEGSPPPLAAAATVVAQGGSLPTASSIPGTAPGLCISQRLSRGISGFSSGISSGIKNSVISITSNDDGRPSAEGVALWPSRRTKDRSFDLEKGEISLSPLTEGEVEVDEDQAADSDKDSAKGSTHLLVVPDKRPLDLLTLPNELKLMLLRFLDFADIERLRRTCKQLRQLANPLSVRTMYGPLQLRSILLGHCKLCLHHDPQRAHLLLANPSDRDYPFASRCIPCAIEQGDKRIRIGRKVTLGNYNTVWVCRWCGWPVTDRRAYGHDQFHRPCYKHYSGVLLSFFVLGWVQLGLGITGAALSFRYYRHEVMVFAPALTAFVLLWVCLGLLIARGNRSSTYSWSLFIELAIIGVLIPQVYYLFGVLFEPANPPGIAIGLLLVCLLNMLFRLLNAIGNIILVRTYDVTYPQRPHMPSWRRFLHPLVSGLIFWTYPQALERKYPPSFYR